jgi:hypothetical protein
MKNLFVLLAMTISVVLNAQNVGIGTNTPASKLTIDGTDPDIGIMNSGLAVGLVKAYGFDLKMNTASDNPLGKLMFGTKGNDYFNIDHLGRVSIGTSSNFDAHFKLNGSSPIFGFLHNEVQKGFIRVAGDHFKMGTYPANTGNIVFSPKNVDKIWIDEDGQMGIGTASPVSLLTVNGINPHVQMQHNGVSKGFMQALGDNLKIGTNSTNTTGNLVFQTKLIDRMMIDDNGLVGIGTTTPSSILTINSSNPILQMRNNNVDKGYIQIVNDDLKIGTNLTNDLGRFIVRTDGSDRLFINNKGQMGLNVVPDAFNSSFSIGEDEDGNSGIQLTYQNASRASFRVSGNTTNLTASTGYLYIYRNGSYPFVAHPDGNFSLGGHNAVANYRFSIYGRAIATEFTALPYADWPDYDFADGYKLKPLAEVKKFIAENKHLPNIPSAAQIENDGIQLGDMSRRLMEKVEELTLYVLQLQEQIDELKKKQSGKN